MSNPYSLHRSWSQETVDRFASMPKTPDGHVIAPQYVPAGIRGAYVDAWRRWCALNERKWWPLSIHAWANEHARHTRKGAQP